MMVLGENWDQHGGGIAMSRMRKQLREESMTGELLTEDSFVLRETPQKMIDNIKNKRSQLGIDLSNPANIPKKKQAEYLDLIIDEIRLRTSVAGEQVFYIGQLLYEAKQLLPHGSYEKWIERYLPNISLSTAKNFRDVYETFALSPNSIRHLQKSILYFLSSDKCNEQLKEAYLNAEEVDTSISLKELTALSVKMNRQELTIDSPEISRFIHLEQNRIKLHKYATSLHLLKDKVIQFLSDVTLIHNSNPVMPVPSNEQENDDDAKHFEEMNSFASDILAQIEGFLNSYDAQGRASSVRTREEEATFVAAKTEGDSAKASRKA